MANTLQSLFPNKNIRADHYNVYPCYCRFAAPIVAGKYIFNATTTPPVEFGKLLQNQVGIIAGVMISANCTEADFSAAIDEPLYLQIIHGGNRTPVNMKPFPFCNFSQADNYQEEFICSTTSAKYDEPFLLGVTGEVNQLLNMSQNELILKVSFNFIRADKEEFERGFETVYDIYGRRVQPGRG